MVGKKVIAIVLILALFPVSGLISKPIITGNGISETSSFEKEAQDGGQVKKSRWFGKVVLWTLAIAAVGAVVYFLVIKKPEYTLTVKTEGVTGSPAAGTYTYKKGTQVDYNFSPLPGYKQLTVLLDGNPINASGKIEMNGDHKLTVSALEVGNYTSIKYQVHYILKDYNAMQGVFTVQLRDENKKMLKRIGENSWGYNSPNPGTILLNPTCADAFFDKEATVDFEMQRTDIYVYQDYQVVPWQSNTKPFMCPFFTFTILSYTWETGKADPGTPQILHIDDLQIDPVKDFFQKVGDLWLWRKEIRLEFVRPPNPTKAQRVFVVSACGEK